MLTIGFTVVLLRGRVETYSAGPVPTRVLGGVTWQVGAKESRLGSLNDESYSYYDKKSGGFTWLLNCKTFCWNLFFRSYINDEEQIVDSRLVDNRLWKILEVILMICNVDEMVAELNNWNTIFRRINNAAFSDIISCKLPSNGKTKIIPHRTSWEKAPGRLARNALLHSGSSKIHFICTNFDKIFSIVVQIVNQKKRLTFEPHRYDSDTNLTHEFCFSLKLS